MLDYWSMQIAVENLKLITPFLEESLKLSKKWKFRLSLIFNIGEKNDLSIKEVTKNMALDLIEWRKRMHMLILIGLLRIHNRL